MLTDTQCRAARPREMALKLAHGGGLVLEVKPNGVRAWRHRFKLTTNGRTKESMFAIGDYDVALRGETPEQAKARRLNMLQRVVFGKIGTLPFKQVSPLHILDVLGRLEQSGDSEFRVGYRA